MNGLTNITCNTILRESNAIDLSDLYVNFIRNLEKKPSPKDEVSMVLAQWHFV
jgi:hypothetical protein